MEYEHAKKSVKERKKYGVKHRKKILSLLPATINELAKKTGRSRTSINHHLWIMRDVVSCDASKQPHVYSVKEKK